MSNVVVVALAAIVFHAATGQRLGETNIPTWHLVVVSGVATVIDIVRLVTWLSARQNGTTT